MSTRPGSAPPDEAEAVRRLAQSLSREAGLPAILCETAERMQQLCDASSAEVHLLHPGTGRLEAQRPRFEGNGKPVLLSAPTDEDTAAMRCARAGRSRLEPLSAGADATVLCVPLLQGGDVLGVLEVRRPGGAPPFTRVHQSHLETLAPHVSIAVHTAQMRAELETVRSEVLQTRHRLEETVQFRIAQIGRAKREWEKTFDAISEPIALVQDFTVRRANLAYARRANVPIREVPGQKCYALFAGRTAPCPHCPLQRRGAARELEGEIRTEPGSTFRVSGFELSMEADATDSVVVHYRDVTRERMLEQRLRASERLSALGQLADGAAHEINNPLAFMLSNLRSLKDELRALREPLETLHQATEMAQAGASSDAIARLLRQPGTGASAGNALKECEQLIEEALLGGRRVGDVVRGMRELARQRPVNIAPVRLRGTLARALETEFAESAPKVSVTGEDVTVLGDAAELETALAHLLRNAKQAAGDASRVQVTLERTSLVALVRIHDEGPGIPEEHLHRIYEPFFTTRGVGQGVGLGLTTAYGILRSLGGGLEAESTPGKGATFVVQLPLGTEPLDVSDPASRRRQSAR